MKKEVFFTRLPEGKRKELKVIAAARGRTMQYAVLEAIDDWLSKGRQDETNSKKRHVSSKDIP